MHVGPSTARKCRRVYHYAPLDETKNEIRIFRLYCGKATEEFVKGKLDIIELHNNQPRDYKALSYAWGDPTRNHVIHIDGEALGVATNLYNALLRLSRQPSQQSSQTDEDPLYLWIDAICIDQDNVRERNHQVPRMHTIYSAASEVLVWLGCGSQRSAHSLSTVLGESSRPPPSGEYATEAVETLVHSAWTRRLWTVQEVALACGPVTVMYGSFSFPWTKLMVELNRTKVLENPGTLSLAKCFVQRRNLQRTPSSFKTVLPSLSKQPFSLTSLIRETIGFQFSNPSDRVYALLGMAGPDTRMSIPVDYNKPLLDVYMDAIQHILTYERSLNVLFIAIGEEFGVLPSLMEFSFPAWTRPLYVTFNDESDSFLRDGSPYSSWESWDNFPRFSIRAKIRRTRRTIEFNSNRRELLDEGRASGNLRPVFTMCRHEGLLSIRGMELGVVHSLSPEKEEPAAQWVCRELSLSLAEFKDSYWAPFWITIHMGLSKSLHIPQIYLEQNRLTIDESSDDDTMADEWVTRRSVFTYVDKLTGKLYFGSALTKPRQGDLVCILFGSNIPCLLRLEANKLSVYDIVDVCYIAGAMKGQMIATAIAAGFCGESKDVDESSTCDSELLPDPKSFGDLDDHHVITPHNLHESQGGEDFNYPEKVLLLIRDFTLG